LILAVKILSDYKGELDCSMCDEKLREERGHDKDGIIPFMVDGERILRCPLTVITPLSWQYIKAFSFYDKGRYPNGLIYTHESEKYLQAMMILDIEFGKLQIPKKDKHGKHRT